MLSEKKRQKLLKMKKRKDVLYRKYLAASELARGFADKADDLGAKYQNACLKYFENLHKAR